MSTLRVSVPADVQVDFGGKQEESEDESPTGGADSKYSASVPRVHLSSSRSTIVSGLPVCLKVEAARTSPSTASLRGAGVFSGRVGRALFVKRAPLSSCDGGSYASTPCVATPHKDQAATIVLQRSSSACSSLSPVHRAAPIHVLSGTPRHRMCLVFDDASGAQVLKWSYDLKSAATFRVVHLGVSSARRRSAGAVHCGGGPIVLGGGSPRSRRLKADSGFYLESTAFRGLYVSLRDPRSSDSSPCGAPRLVLRASPATLVAMARAPSVPPTTPRSNASATKLDHVRDASSAMWGLEKPDLPTKHSSMVGLVEFLRSAPSTVDQLMHNFVGVSWAQSLRFVCSDLAAFVRGQVVGFRMQPTFELIPLPRRVRALGSLFSAAMCLQRLVLRDMPDLAARHLRPIRYCRKLEIVCFGGCTGLTDEVVSLCATLPRLQELDLSVLAISDDGVEAAVAIHALRSLSLFGCREVTSAPLSRFQDHDSIQVINARGTQVSTSDGAVQALLSSRRQNGLAVVTVLTGDM